MYFRITFAFLCIFSTSYARSLEEPKCHKYDYDEKVFHKLVRLEHQMELTKDQLNVWDREMKGLVENMKSLETNIKLLQEVNTKSLNDALTEQKELTETAITNVNKQVIRMSQDLLDKQAEINTTLLDYKDEVKTPTVVFKARGVANKSPSSGDTIIFGTVVSNIGGGYDTDTGYFTAPRAGTYVFTVQYCTGYQKWMRSNIIAEGNIIGTTTHYNDDASETCTSGDAVTVLSRGDKVWNKCQYATGGSAINENTSFSWNTFSGVLIHTGTE